MELESPSVAKVPPRRNTLYIQVLVGIVLGGALGYFDPGLGTKMQPIGDGFIKLIKMLIAPVIFCTVVAGLAGMADLKRVGRVGGKALLYFEAVTTLALVIGLLVANIFTPGSGIHALTASAAETAAIARYTAAGSGMSVTDTILHIIPATFVGAFADGDILQVLLLALLFGFALGRLGDHGRTLLGFIAQVSSVFFGIVGIVTKLAPLAAFGAMAYTIGKFGIGSLVQLAALMGCVYLTCLLFIIVVLGTIARLAGFNIFRIIRYIREELLIVLGTSSSESGLPGLMAKLEAIGCARPVVGIVVPSGYSFNLDGTCIYLTMAALFIAQATHTALTLPEQLGLLGLLLLTSKGAAGVTGSGFIVLAGTLSMTGRIPVSGLALVFGVDRFMSEARSLTNFIGNAVGTLVVAKWDNAFDESKAGEILAGRSARQL